MTWHESFHLAPAPVQQALPGVGGAESPLSPPLAVPAGGYSAVLMDPPWRYEDQGGRMSTPYRTMPDGELRVFAGRLPRVLARDAHLWCWTTDAHLALALEMLERAGTTFKAVVPWIKTTEAGAPRIGGGHYVRKVHELLLLGVRGAAVPPPPARPAGVILSPRGEHSRKPEAARWLVDEICPKVGTPPRPGPRVELFARAPWTPREGWTAWGDQA